MKVAPTIDIEEYRGIVFSIPRLTPDGITFWPEHSILVNAGGDSPILQAVDTIWDVGRLSETRRPLHVGVVKNPAQFSFPRGTRILDMPIKFPGFDYRLPVETLPWADVITEMARHEHTINPNIDEYFAYLTIDQGVVRAGEMQRKEGCHVDGFQGARVAKKVKINRSYVVSDAVPTVFHEQPFMVEKLDEERDNFFLEFDLQAELAQERRFSPYSIMCMDAYTVHKADIAPITLHRTFLRLSYSVRVFDRLGNAHNGMFDYSWEMMARDISLQLGKENG